ncbi:MAG: undecaprenyldiphospho-muramoylpentapeptide beta-N-acetylglucosaminyltransferase [Phaeodactylibacter sp.]|nr:undecaprenyldiphospho-muramoylpentapeptide beta-N-acetylglucosaminyltransferase [Phaeodactylibacter sp.]MCB9294797.1 undecaprenyldiphospho-muramoylpentapeptide beta-N-acetylglucosaminyltransferase [Lewinellaceae bacterium]
MNPKPKIIISGGGTGGHVFPAIAIADAIKEKQPEAEILFVGAKGKMEMEKVPKAGYPIEGLWISGFHRQLTLRNLLFPLRLLSSLLGAWRIISRFKPDVVAGVGGFASGPLLEVASRRGVPALIQEQNSYAGVTNRLLARKADRVCVAYRNMERFFPAGRLVFTGNPVRKAIQDNRSTREEGARHFGLDPARPILLVFGGSLGARSVNQAMDANASRLRERQEVQVLWQYGQLYEEPFSQCETARLPNVKAQPFIDRMDLAYAMADVIICRSGALTVSELHFAGKPAILIPSPNVAEDHQTKNAMALVDAGAAWIVRDEEAKELAVAKALELLNDEAARNRLSSNIRKLAMPDAAGRIAEEVLELARRGKERGGG